jgi:hypothetical protein
MDETIRFGLFRSNVDEHRKNAKENSASAGELKRISRLLSQKKAIAAPHLRGFTRVAKPMRQPS